MKIKKILFYILLFFSFVGFTQIRINTGDKQKVTTFGLNGSNLEFQIENDILRTEDLSNLLTNFTSPASFDTTLNIPNQSTPPTSSIRAGSLYFDTDDNNVYRYDGSSWSAIGNSDGAITNAVINGNNIDFTGVDGGFNGSIDISNISAVLSNTAKTGITTAQSNQITTNATDISALQTSQTSQDAIIASNTANSQVDASSFSGNLQTTDDTLQEIAQKVNDLVTYNQIASQVPMTGYVKGSDATSVLSSDNVSESISKLENQIDAAVIGAAGVTAQDRIRWDNKNLYLVRLSTEETLTLDNFVSTGADEGKSIKNLIVNQNDTIRVPNLSLNGYTAKFLVPMDSTKHFVAEDDVYFKVNGTTNYERAVTLTTNFNFSIGKLHDTLSIDGKTNQTLYDLTGGLIAFPYTPMGSLMGTNPNPNTTGAELWLDGYAWNFTDNNEQNAVPTNADPDINSINFFGTTQSIVPDTSGYANYRLRIEANGGDGDNDRAIYGITGIGVGTAIDYTISYKAKGNFCEFALLGVTVPLIGDETERLISGSFTSTNSSFAVFPINSSGNGSGADGDYIEFQITLKVQ